MNRLLAAINTFLYNDFIFSPRFRVFRHLTYWIAHTLLWAAFWVVIGAPGSYGLEVLNMLLFLPVFIIYGYPMAYWAVPRFLLKGKIVQFLLLMLGWAVAGLYIDVWYKDYIMIPIQKVLHPNYFLPEGQLAWCYLCITTAAAVPMVIKFFKFWDIKRQDWLQVQQEKITAELQLLKAQVHPHFLFNTLNNIYSFSLESSPKTPGLILKDKFIAPLMMLPFIENAFKHGTSEQIEKCWLNVDIVIKENTLKVKIANSKNEYASSGNNGIGIANVKKRLALIYPGEHQLNISDEGHFFIVSLMIKLNGEVAPRMPLPKVTLQSIKHETTMPAYR